MGSRFRFLTVEARLVVTERLRRAERSAYVISLDPQNSPAGASCYATGNGHLQDCLPQTPFFRNPSHKSVWFQQEQLDFYVTSRLGPA